MWQLVLAGAAVLTLTAACRAEPQPSAAEAAVVSSPEVALSHPTLGLMGTIPIYWGEADGLGDLLASAEPHWARAVLEQRYTLRPLDTLDAASLAGLTHLVLAQPRALSPQENVDLDAWVQGGGRVLLFADPFLTGESHFALGDRRRPQDVVLLSPLLSHWGLELLFDDNQPNDVRVVTVDGTAVPVKLSGHFKRNLSVYLAQSPVHPKSQLGAQNGSLAGVSGRLGEIAGHPCALEAEGILATCSLGRGKAWIFADAALLDLHDPHPSARSAFSGMMEKFSRK